VGVQVVRAMLMLFLIVVSLVVLGTVFIAKSLPTLTWPVRPSVFDIAFIAPWIMLLLALYLLRSDPLLSVAATLTGLVAGLVGVVATDTMLQHLQDACTAQPLPFDILQAYRALGFSSTIAMSLNLITLAIATVHAVKTTWPRAENRPSPGL